MTLIIKLSRSHPSYARATVPTQASGDVGFDLYASEDDVIPAGRVGRVPTGLVIADYEPSIQLHTHTPEASITGENGWYQHRVAGMPSDALALTVFPKVEGRSSLAVKGIFTVAGIIDPSYRGELSVTLANMSDAPFEVRQGDRVGQLVFYTCLVAPDIKFEETDGVTSTRRGSGGFGSTGR